MLLDRQTADVVALVGAGLGALGVGLGAVASIQLVRMRKAYGVLQGGGRRDDFVTAVNRHVGAVGDLRSEVAGVQDSVARVRDDLADALRHVAVVRYDAFPDMGGRLSFSAALLDDGGDGLVLTSINGRTETRTYAKGVKAGVSEHQLSPEEDQAIAFASRSRS
ncbi:MAG: hypothetical protein QOE45_344 [Frankiaceae bacterium]|jgi:hypothetical protein|nr:hypothetical protein [Frankiaceae bacterium]